MASSAEFRFVCPDCAESMTVNEPMMDALLTHGCVICGQQLSESDFSQG